MAPALSFLFVFKSLASSLLCTKQHMRPRTMSASSMATWAQWYLDSTIDGTKLQLGRISTWNGGRWTMIPMNPWRASHVHECVTRQRWALLRNISPPRKPFHPMSSWSWWYSIIFARTNHYTVWGAYDLL